MTSLHRHSLATPALLTVLVLTACQTVPDGAECRSYDGRRVLRSPAPAVQSAASLAADLAAAEAALAAAPQDRDAAVWVARRLGYLGRFRDAIEVLTRALDDHPGDPFLLRHRGHRWITLREFGKAAWDLEAAALACRTTADAVEPDGRPTPGRPPHSSLHYNVYYHLGLALFLVRDLRLAEEAWLRCLAVVDDDESRVAVTHWLWCVRMRAGDVAGAAAVVAPIHPAMDVVENRSYHQLCLLYAGKVERSTLQPLSGSAGHALAFGLAHHRLVSGDRDGARRDFEALASEPGWASFGVIAAEVEAARL
jgi:tetratricopeptide (TPR) repeat protein